MPEENEIKTPEENFKNDVRALLKKYQKAKLKEFIDSVENYQQIVGSEYSINQNKWHNLCDKALKI